MRWIDEANKTFPDRPHRALVLEPGEALKPALVEYWKRILTDGYALAPGSRTALAIDIYVRTFEADETGCATAAFRNSLNRRAEEIGEFRLRSDHFDLLQAKDEDDDAFGRRELAWFLERYAVFKEALKEKESWALYERMHSSYPLKIRAATVNGFFDFQPGETGFGALPEDDRRLLAGKEPRPEDPLETLTAGVLDIPQMRLVEEVNQALIQYTPEHFKTIHCTITEGLQQGQRALFYDIRCPEFPDEGTTAANERLHTAATQLVEHLAPQQGTFGGIRIILNMQANGSWLHSLEHLGR